MNYCLLPHSVLKIMGKDAKNFLQGIISQDINLTNNNNTIYSLILNSKGRYLYNFFIIPIDDYFLIEVNNNDLNALIKCFNFYKLRSKFELTITNYSAYALLTNNLPITFNNNSNTASINEHIIFKDPRLNSLGYKLISNSPEELPFFKQLIPVDLNEYTTLRYALAVPEENELVKEKSIPIECGFDELNALSYNKGCYLGQEFTNSAKRTLEIRKRIIAFTFEAHQDFNNLSNTITNSNNEKIGTVLGVHNNYLLALVKIQAVISNSSKQSTLNLTIIDQFFITSNNIQLAVTPLIPSWISSYSLT